MEFALLDLFELVVFVIFLVLLLTQVVIPLLTKSPLFPFLRKSRAQKEVDLVERLARAKKRLEDEKLRAEAERLEDEAYRLAMSNTQRLVEASLMKPEELITASRSESTDEALLRTDRKKEKPE